ncbi:metallophosphoesterase [Candidatus Bathyarchaeota archaeon]|nr:metallophosphoesterase [Candidatus Bathyarchaeota archaeon]
MIVGLISDIHDRLPLLEKAVDRLNKEKVDLVLCAGDYVAPFVTPYFKALKARMIGVFGNNDAEKQTLKKRFSDMGFDVQGSFRRVEVDGLKVALLHGNEVELLKSVLDLSSFDVIVYGHTHKAEVQRRNGKLVINPGEVCGYLSGRSTIARLDTETLEAEIIELR